MCSSIYPSNDADSYAHRYSPAYRLTAQLDLQLHLQVAWQWMQCCPGRQMGDVHLGLHPRRGRMAGRLHCPVHPPGDPGIRVCKPFCPGVRVHMQMMASLQSAARHHVADSAGYACLRLHELVYASTTHTHTLTLCIFNPTRWLCE